MLRVMNAKSILVVCPDFATSSDATMRSLRAICDAVDIPVQFDPSTHAAGSPESIREGLEAGAYRVVTTVSNGDDADVVCRLLAEVGAQRLTVRFPAAVCFGADDSMIRLLGRLAESDCSRIMVTMGDNDSWRKHPDFERKLRDISAIRKRRPFRITVDGGIRDAPDLLELKALAVPGVDSVALGEPLYTSRFPCQAVWCWNFRDEIDLDRVSTAPLRSD